MLLTLEHLRRYAVARTLFTPTTLKKAIARLGFVQADPIRSPARAQDLILRHRVIDYHAGDLERRYARLPIEEDFFVNYGFLPREHHRLMHPRVARTLWTPTRTRHAQQVLEFIRERGKVHPRTVDAHFAHGKITNWFGGSSNATTHLLDDMHYRGLLRVARREGGTRVYAVRDLAGVANAAALDAATAGARHDALIDLVVHLYAPLPAASLGQLLSLLGRGTPQWIAQRAGALKRAKQRFAHTKLNGIHWYWPADESPTSKRWRLDEQVRLLTPFDPIVWDRRRFSLLWDWSYRFEAYTPAAKRKLGYYALPLLWRGDVIGWGNVTASGGALRSSFGFAKRAPADPAFKSGIEEEMARLGSFVASAAVEPTDQTSR